VIYFNTAVLSTLMLACGYAGINLFIESVTRGDAIASLLSAGALVLSWLGLKLTWNIHNRSLRERG